MQISVGYINHDAVLGNKMRKARLSYLLGKAILSGFWLMPDKTEWRHTLRVLTKVFFDVCYHCLYNEALLVLLLSNISLG